MAVRTRMYAAVNGGMLPYFAHSLYARALKDQGCDSVYVWLGTLYGIEKSAPKKMREASQAAHYARLIIVRQYVVQIYVIEVMKQDNMQYTTPPIPRRSGVSTVRPNTRSLAFHHRGANEIGPQRSRMSRKLVLGPLLQTYSLGSVKASAGAGHKGRRRMEVFFNTPLPLARHDRHPGIATSATRTGIGVSAGITGGARRSRRLQGVPPTMAGRVRSAKSAPQNTHEASSSAPCILRGLVDVANTPLCEPTMSLHDGGLPFDRGK